MRDHPRSRGEYRPYIDEDGVAQGSSPLSRGIHRRQPVRQCGAGIIPALAGNTCQRETCEFDGQDHPRSRGEYGAPQDAFPFVVGSSPLSRGIRFRPGHALPQRGIIPALAGNTWTKSAVRSTRPDHPRSRGEYTHPDYLRAAVVGSSPLSRGIPRGGSGTPRSRGIIPALAGNTLRLCRTAPDQVGIIPALAGNTVAASSRPEPSQDHPRSRGEYHHASIITYLFSGSSPLSRGIH